MAESDTHRMQMTDALIYPLTEWFRGRDDVYVSGNMFLYYKEGSPRAVVAPDVFVVFGVPNKARRVYKLWEEGQPPAVVFELTSKSTRRDDLVDKRFLYEELGVREYFLFDPLHEYLHPPLQGFRLDNHYYAPIAAEQLDDGRWRMVSQELNLALHTQGQNLRLFDAQANRYLLMPAEEAAARRAAEQRSLQETAARRAAEAEIARLRELLAQRDNG